MIELKGPGAFKSGDIQKDNTDFEILNPEHHIATLNKDADLKMELKIGRGRGYVPAEENVLPDQPIGTVPLDSINNPIRKVNYLVENTRECHRKRSRGLF